MYNFVSDPARGNSVQHVLHFIRSGVAYIAVEENIFPVLPYYVGGKGKPTRVVAQFFQSEPVLEKQGMNIVKPQIFKHGRYCVHAQLGRGAVRGFPAGNYFSVIVSEVVSFQLFVVAGRAYLAVIANHVCALAAGKVRKSAAGEFKPQLQNSLFGVNNGEVGVGGKSLLGHNGMPVIVVYAFPAVFLVAANNKLYSALGLKTLVFKRFKADKRNHGGSLVVHGSPAPNSAGGVIDLAAERFARPAAARGHNVQMCKHGEILALAEFYLADIVVVINGFEAVALRQRKKIIKTVRRAVAEGLALFRGILRGVVLHAFRNSFNTFFKIIHVKAA